MSIVEYHNAGNTEAQQQQGLSFLLAQAATGKAAPGVLTGFAVTQTATASGSVLASPGAGVTQAATLDGTGLLYDLSQATLDIFTANPMGGVPRNDIVVLDRATTTVRPITGTPNATPTDPTVPTSAIPLARLRHNASATTIPAANIDDLRTFTNLFGVESFGPWVNLTITGGSGWSAVSGIPLQARLLPGDRVEVVGAVLAGASISNNVVATFPLGMRPSVTRYLSGHITGDAGHFAFNPYVLSTGEMKIEPNTAMGPLVASVSYPVAGIFPL